MNTVKIAGCFAVRRAERRSFLRTQLALAASGVLSAGVPRCLWAEEVLPKHITPATLRAVNKGLEFLARTQGSDGGWHEDSGGEAYPIACTALAGTALLAHGDTTTRGPYASHVQQTVEYLLSCVTPSGLITGPNQELGRPMHGHGFALMFLALVYGMETHAGRRKRIKEAVDAAIMLTARGQSGAGGWTYIPGGGDEGSVTVTQVQALRAAHNAGFDVPKGTIEEAVRYIERCQTPEGGICYSLGSGGGPRLAISAAAVATLYNAGEYDAPVAERCLDYVWKQFKANPGWSKGGWHDFYTHLYASQAYYTAGDKYWDEYFPEARDQLLSMQDKNDGSWQGDGIGKTYGTAIALIILQLPYKYLPIYQR
ncbi:MAG: terpene cyclase/mutase family protein [Pirellulales bacterium]|nr:terpene cyclase/mutase family protein [Pirellulales bacterium]